MKRCIGLGVAFVACTSASPPAGDRDGPAAPGGDARYTACDRVEPMAPREALAATPRPDARAELLAVETSGAFVAPDPLYQRVTKELAAIARLDPRTADIEPFVEFAADLIVVLEEDAWQADQRAQYHAWSCLNEAYGVKEIDHNMLPRMRGVKLGFGDRRWNAARLAPLYAAVPGVRSAAADGMMGDGPDVCLEVQGDTHHYIFDKAGGDCPAGCTEHLYLGFEAGPDGTVTPLGSSDGAAAPAWFERRRDCRARL
jgi:hypothetical protein